MERIKKYGRKPSGFSVKYDKFPKKTGKWLQNQLSGEIIKPYLIII